MLKSVYSNNALKKTAVFKSIKHFSEGREDYRDDARPGRPSKSYVDENIEHVRSLVFL